MDIWDWQNGRDRSVQVRPGSAPFYADVRDQFFIAVEPIDHLAIVPGPTPDQPETWEELVLSKIEKLVRQIETRILESRARQDEMLAMISRTEAEVRTVINSLYETHVKLAMIKDRQDNTIEGNGPFGIKLVLRRTDRT